MDFSENALVAAGASSLSLTPTPSYSIYKSWGYFFFFFSSWKLGTLQALAGDLQLQLLFIAPCKAAGDDVRAKLMVSTYNFRGCVQDASLERILQTWLQFPIIFALVDHFTFPLQSLL